MSEDRPVMGSDIPNPIKPKKTSKAGTNAVDYQDEKVLSNSRLESKQSEAVAISVGQLEGAFREISSII